MVIVKELLCSMWRKCILILLLIASGTFLIVLAYTLPQERIKENVAKSAILFENEGTYPQLIYGNQDSQLDNWTDALMLLVAAECDRTNVVRSAMLNTYTSVSDLSPAESLVAIVNKQVQSNQEVYTANYGRYWHGYNIYLKPLLCFFDYQTIRYIIMYTQIVLFVALFATAGKQKRMLLVIPLLSVYLFCNPLVTMQSLQLSTIMTLILIQILCFLVREKTYLSSPGSVITQFIVFGCLTSYFDLLTYPLASLCIPLAYWVCLVSPGQKITDILALIFKSAAAWGFAYVCMWSSKWCIATLLTGENVIRNAFNQAVQRTSYSNEAESICYESIVKLNIQTPNQILVLIPLVATVTLIVFSIIYKVYKEGSHFVLMLIRRAVSTLFGIALLAFTPFLWFAVFSEHSYQHFWFTYRELSITLYCMSLCGVFVYSTLNTSNDSGGRIISCGR